MNQSDKKIKKSLFSLLAIVSFCLAIYFSVFVTNPVMTIIWLVFAIVLLAIGWENLHSISFGTAKLEMKMHELTEKVNTVSQEMQDYWQQVDERNKSFPLPEFVISIDTDAKFIDLDKDIEDIAENLINLTDRLAAKIPSHELGDNIIACVNIPIMLRKTRIQMAIKYYEMLESHNIEMSSEEKQRYKTLKKEFIEISDAGMAD